MKKLSYLILFLLLGLPTLSICQSVFATQADVANYLIGEWSLDSIFGGWSGVNTIPSEDYWDNARVDIQFISNANDVEHPLICKLYLNGFLQSVSLLTLEEKEYGGFGYWLLNGMPSLFLGQLFISEGTNFMGPSPVANRVTLNQWAFDGHSFRLSRDFSSTVVIPEQCNLLVYPNPIIDDLLCLSISNESNPASVSIYNAAGSLLLQFNYGSAEDVCVNIDHFAAGAYLVVVNSACEARLVETIVKLD